MGKRNLQFVVGAYALFWALLLVTGFSMMKVGDSPAVQALTVLCSWTPTIALLLLFKKLLPGSTIKGFYKRAFSARLNWKLLAVVTLAQIAAFIIAVAGISLQTGLSFPSLFDLSARTVGTGLLMCLIQGATGEESGWRGFLQPSFEKKYSVIKSSLFVGIIWGFWHGPLWILTSGYAGSQLALFILMFLLNIISAAVVIGVCYSRCRNLVAPMWIHFVFNFSMQLFAGTALDMIIWLGILYAIMAVCYALWHNLRHGRYGQTS